MTYNNLNYCGSTIVNDPSKRGQMAAQPKFFGRNQRYRIAPCHTHYDQLQWFVWDMEDIVRKTKLPRVIKQADTPVDAIKDLINYVPKGLGV